jgi:quercetin dioxygenase-like cupin family protein
MPIVKARDIKLQEVRGEGIKSVRKANVIAENEGWKSHTLRLFRLEPGGYTPRHKHPWEHVNYITGGRGRLRLGDQVREVDKGDFAFVPPEVEHQFDNPFDETFEFICIIPNAAEY